MNCRRIAAWCAAGFALLAFAPHTSGQERSLYQQTQYQGREIGNLTGDVYLRAAG